MGRPPSTPEPDSAFYVRLEEWGMRRRSAEQITIRELAEMLDVKVSTLGAWKRAANNPRRNEAKALSQRTGISWSELRELRDQLEEQVAERKQQQARQTLREAFAPPVVDERKGEKGA